MTTEIDRNNKLILKFVSHLMYSSPQYLAGIANASLVLKNRRGI